ncbi:hypothetical protein LPJ66_004776 [Kickxella alabastrina]|uniref:Uncharacterized protein n=1 Tax=Kickxella alabastrina TaxID=61397 RepID=A0ACC1IKQ9_9FUNG|nr:hypothetical protein LPJ66_004776 [Kickxella alabastrina]
MMVVSMVWFVGDLQGNGHLPLANTPLTNCKAFGFWMRILMGACTICALTAFRAYGLYRVFFLNLPYHTVGLYLPFFIYYMIMLVYGIVAQVLKSSLTIEYFAPLDICNYKMEFKVSLFAFMWLSWVAIIGVFWKIRNIKSSFNEGREMMVTLPMYNCMFNRQEYLSRWILKLRKDGLQNEYDDDPNASGGHSHVLSASYNVRNNMLYSSTGGKGDSKGFQQIGDGCYQSKDNSNV